MNFGAVTLLIAPLVLANVVHTDGTFSKGYEVAVPGYSNTNYQQQAASGQNMYSQLGQSASSSYYPSAGASQLYGQYALPQASLYQSIYPSYGGSSMLMPHRGSLIRFIFNSIGVVVSRIVLFPFKLFGYFKSCLLNMFNYLTSPSDVVPGYQYY